MRLPGREFLGLDCIPVRERQKNRISDICACHRWNTVLIFCHIQTYRCICVDTYTHSHTLCPQSVMQEQAPVQPGCHGCQRFQANAFKTPHFIQTLTAKVVHKRPCETCLRTYARWFTPPPFPPEVLEPETLLTRLRAIFSHSSMAGIKQTFSAFVVGEYGRWWGYASCDQVP